MADIAEQLAQVLGHAVRFVLVPDAAVRAATIASGMSPWLAGMFVEYGRAYGSGWGDFTTTHAKDVTGRPARSLLDFARESWPRTAG